MKKIVFFLDTKQPINNRQILFLDLAAYMANHTNDEVYYINNYFEVDNMRYQGTSIVYGDVNNFDFSKLEGATFFTPANYLMHLVSKIQNLNSAKICLYVYDPQAIDWLSYHMDAKVRSKKSIVDLLENTKSCSYLNYSCVLQRNVQNRYSDEIFIPIALRNEISENYTSKKVVDSNLISIGFVGDINAITQNTIYNLINNLSIIGLDKKVDLHFIGNRRVLLNTSFKECSSNRVRLIFTGAMEEYDKKEYIENNIDIVLATEENALTSALCGVPVIIPVINDGAIIGNNYVYLYDVFGYHFKWNCRELLSYDLTYYRIVSILNDIYEKGEKEIIAQKCYDFCIENCSLEKIAQKFEILEARTQLNIQECLSNECIYGTIQKYNEYLKFNDGSFSDYLQNR